MKQINQQDLNLNKKVKQNQFYNSVEINRPKSSINNKPLEFKSKYLVVQKHAKR